MTAVHICARRRWDAAPTRAEARQQMRTIAAAVAVAVEREPAHHDPS